MSDLIDVTEAAKAAPSSPDGPANKERNASLWADAWRQLIRRPSFIIPTLFLLVIASMALLPQLWTKYHYRDCDINNSRKSPSAEHIFGFNVNGCDYWSAAIYGSRPSLEIAIFGTALIVVLGGIVGLLAGYYGGWVDSILSRITDIFFALPFLLGAIVLLVMLRNRSAWTISFVLGVLGWVTIARLLRGTVIQGKNLDYVQAARALGASSARLMFKHILPNAAAPVLVYATISLGGFVSAEATLSFLGVGLIPPQTSWGIMISQNEQYWQTYPWLLLFPCIFLVGTVLSFILIGDALRDALDPRLR